MQRKQKRPKRKQSSRKSRRLRLPKGNNYIWQILNTLIVDYRVASDGTWWLDERVEKLARIIRDKNIRGYIEWCDDLALKKLNSRGFHDCHRELEIVRWARVFTLAQKYDFEDSPYNKLETALQAFIKYEANCHVTNGKPLFRKFDTGEASTAINEVFTYPVLRYARDFIAKVVGLHPDLHRFLDATRHGPGATSAKSGDNAIPIAKYCPPYDVTPRAKDLLISVIKSDQRWSRSIFDWYNKFHSTPPDCVSSFLERGLSIFTPIEAITKDRKYSRILFVPKNSKTLRTIAAEPTGNIYLQLAVDGLIRSGLKKYGIDLNTQEKNKELAYIGSTDNSLVTLDLSGASDTIALVWLLLFPDSWQKLLYALRCSEGRLPTGETVRFAKLSAMGNGYTFVVESLIFAALIYGVARTRGSSWKESLPKIAVYGDDLIIPAEWYSDLAYILRQVGFILNVDKSFVHGPVRESCGADFISGHEISRPTLKDRPSREWELVRDYNSLYLLDVKYGLGFENTLSKLLSWAPYKNFGPIHENLYGWFFAKNPQTTPIGRVEPCTNCREAYDWQTPVYKIKTYDLKYRSTKPVRRHKYFEPMMYLSRPRGKPPWYANFNAGFRIDEPVASELFYTKKQLVQRTSVTVIPWYDWVEPQHPVG